jgi:hypothetical protein
MKPWLFRRAWSCKLRFSSFSVGVGIVLHHRRDLMNANMAFNIPFTCALSLFGPTTSFASSSFLPSDLYCWFWQTGMASLAVQ